jgi:4a-hydroxytetrahydrobiopterin dehydratase
MVEPLSASEVAAALVQRPGWTGGVDGIERTVTAATFLDGIRLVGTVAHAAEAADHHPDIDIRWRRVRFRLVTHDAGGVTARDLALADKIDRAVGDVPVTDT